MSFTAFAEKAGVSQSQVSTYYRAWELAADDHKCLHARDLCPGQEDLEDFEEEDAEHTRQLWSKYLEKARKPKKSRGAGSTQGSIAADSTPETTGSAAPEAKVNQAVEALAKTSEQLSKKLIQVVNVTPLRGEDAELAQFAEELRRTRSVLDRYCQEIDRVLARIGFGDTDPGADNEST